MLKQFCLGLFVLICGSAFAEKNMILDNCADPASWSFFNGAEFPGAKGGMKRDTASGKINIAYDFTGGGKYVGAFPKASVPAGTEKFLLKLQSTAECQVNCRVIDATGRTFQGRAVDIKPGTADIAFRANGPWINAWGGDNSLKQPKGSFKNFILLISPGKNLMGSVIVHSLQVEGDKLPEPQFAGQDFELTGGGWKVVGKWLSTANGPVLSVTADNLGGGETEFYLDFPTMSRDQVSRYTLPGKEKRLTFTYTPPLVDGGNPNNAYDLIAGIKNHDGDTTTKKVLLAGKNSGRVGMGEPINSRDIKTSRFGTCAHFSYGNNGAFKAWKPYRELTDIAAAAGFKWLRDGCSAKKVDGKFQMGEYDLEWIKYVKGKGIDIILCLRLYPDMSIDDYKDYVTAIVKATSEYVNVYELGNEPNNFGWKPKFGGTWNGYEKDGTVSTWVKEHVKYTNALADHIKKIRPDATVIGLGSCPPTNFHALNQGVSKSLDGVVDHPYTYSMPPEKVPFGWNMEKRDGIKVGDKDNSFAGLINSYVEHFQKTGVMRSVWVTEFGFTSFWFDGKTEKGLYAGFSEEAQATYLVRRFIHSLALPVMASCQYDLIDDYNSSEFKDEGNFGLIRGDHSRKPAYYAIQRMTSLFSGFDHDPAATVKVEKEPLHRSSARGDLIKDWDKAAIAATNGVMAFAFANPARPEQRMLAVWSALPYSGEFNNRVCTIRIDGWKGFSGKPVAIDIINGRRFDVPLKIDGDTLLLDNLSLKNHPIVIKFLKP